MNSSWGKIICAIACVFMLSACERDLSGSTVHEYATAGKVLEGKIISARTVTVKAHEKMGQNQGGMLLGGGAGLAAGSAIGSGSGNTGAMIGGAILGALAGAAIEDAASTQQATEYLVKIDKKYMREYKSITKKITSNSKQGINADLNVSADVSTKSDIIAVVQEAEEGLGVGKRVYIIYNDARPRITPNTEG